MQLSCSRTKNLRNMLNLLLALCHTQLPMSEPTIAADGFTYERAAIEAWLRRGNATSPVTGEPLAHTNVVANHALRSAMQDLLLVHGN